jgi:TRAP-type C4-dicarboxylate transport system permease small subunit
MISLAFLGMGLAMRRGNHSSFSILQNILPDKPRKLLRVLVLLITLASIAGFCYLGFLYAMASMNNRTEALRWRTGYWYMMIPLGSLMFIWHTLIIAREYINQSRQADIEREIAAGGEMVDDSEFLKGIELNADEEKI